MLVQFNSARVLGFHGKKIIPGINEVDEEIVEAMMEDPIVAGKFDQGELEIIGRDDIGAKKIKTKKGKEPTAVEMLLAASDKSALDLVAKTVDLAILKEWHAREKRHAVKRSIRDRISKITDIKYRDKDDKKKFEKAPSKEDAEEGEEE